MKSIDLDKINSLLDELKSIRIKEARILRERLLAEKEKLAKSQTQKPVSDMINANKRRSSFMKNVWRYIKLLRDTYPDLRNQFTPREMFVQFFARRRGKDVDINDVYWQNPSV